MLSPVLFRTVAARVARSLHGKWAGRNPAPDPAISSASAISAAPAQAQVQAPGPASLPGLAIAPSPSPAISPALAPALDLDLAPALASAPVPVPALSSHPALAPSLAPSLAPAPAPSPAISPALAPALAPALDLDLAPALASVPVPVPALSSHPALAPSLAQAPAPAPTLASALASAPALSSPIPPAPATYCRRWRRVGMPPGPRSSTSIGVRPFSSGGGARATGGGAVVLGIETSCDETGAAVVDEEGRVLGEGLHSQKRIHVRNGGIIPTLAQDLHRQHIDSVVQDALRTAGLNLKDVTALATTVMPGLALCLQVGLQYSKDLLLRHPALPFIPVHHMIAHALTVRMIERVEFPYLVLLISGGHCLLAVARGVNDFLLLGQSLDSAPGEAFDKVARRLQLQLLPACQGLGGGQALELMAQGGSIRLLMDRDRPLFHARDCNFSFSGLKCAANWLIGKHEATQGITPEDAHRLATLPDIAASFQHKVAHHLVTRVARAMEFCQVRALLSDSAPTLVVSGGVASNAYINRALRFACDRHGYRLHCPPPALCTDNGIMIAWAGMELLKQGIGIAPDPQTIRYEPKFPMGKDISSEVAEANIKMKRIKFW